MTRKVGRMGEEVCGYTLDTVTCEERGEHVCKVRAAHVTWVTRV